MRAKVAERGQVTIPKVLRERLGIRPGTVLEFKEDHGKLVAAEAGGQYATRISVRTDSFQRA